MLIIVSLFLIYIVFITLFILGTLLLKSHKHTSNYDNGVSIIVSIRDGESALPILIQNLQNQSYPGPMEFILVDDESTDKTKDIILNACKTDARFRYLSSADGNENLHYKKKGLDAGIQSSLHDYLLFTDVDCELKSSWVSSMVGCFDMGSEYIVGNSIVKKSNQMNLVSVFQKIEFLLLMILCRSSSFLSYPWASSGQNQGFTKSLYNRVGGFNQITDFIGDDTAFLQLCKSNGAVIHFNDRLDCQTLCRIERSMINFIIQRARWVSDANKIWKMNILFFSLMVFTYFFFISIPIIVMFELNRTLIVMIALKINIESLLIIIGSSKFNVKINPLDLLVWHVFHLPYIILIVPLSYFSPLFKWKGRKLNSI